MILSDYLKQILVCPKCSNSLLIVNNNILCNSCGEVGMLEDDVLHFKTDQSSNPQNPFYDDENYKRGIQTQREKQHLHYNSKSLSGKLEKYFKDELMKIVVDDKRPFFDIGCGTGSGFKHLGYPKSIVGIDISFDLVKTCKINFPEADCICCDMNHPPLRKNSLTTVFCLETLEHIFYLEHFVESIQKLLSDDGFFYVLIPTEGGFAWSVLRNIAHYKYSKEYQVNYKKMFQKVHCNTANTIDNVLNKFFKFDLVRDIPWRIGGTNLNLVKLYRLRKRN